MSTTTDLLKLGETPSTVSYLRSTWGRREFAAALASGQIRGENMDTVLGNLWHLLNPLFLVGVYYLMFGVMLRVDRGLDNFLGFLSIGIFTFHYTQKCVVSGAKTITSNLGLVRSLAFPRAVLPLATVGAQTLAFLPAAGVMVAIAVVTGEVPGPMWALILVVFAIQALFNLGAAFMIARIAEGFHDITQILPYLFRILLYVSGILFPARAFVDHPTLLFIFDVNPMYIFPTLVRGPLLDQSFDLRLASIALAWACVMAVVGFTAFRLAEYRYGRG